MTDKDGTNRIARFWTELKRRRVIRVTIAYIIFAWLALQVVAVISPMLDWPNWVGRVTLLALSAGLPISIILSWIFDITPSGIQRDSAALPKRDEDVSLAVLPFVDMSKDGDQGYFCDGVADEILNQLNKITALRVASRTSSFHFRNRSVDAREIGRTVGVSAVLEGGVRKQGNALRVSVSLINAHDESQIWTGKFDRQLEDIFIIQDEIANEVSKALQLVIDPKTKKFMKSGRTDEIQAYEFYLKAWDKFYGYTGIHLRQARQLFKKAVTIDPGFGKGWAGLAATNAFHCIYCRHMDELAKEARVAAEKAVALCPELPESHAALGMSFLIDEEYEQAEKQFKQGLKIDPFHFESLYFYARASAQRGQHKIAAEFYDKAINVRPEDYTSYLIGAQSWSSLGNKEKSSAWLRTGLDKALVHLEKYPSDARAMVLAASSYQDIGEFEKGKALIENAIVQEPDEGPVFYNAACFYALAGKKEKALELLAKGAKLGIAPKSWVENDSDFEILHGTPEFDKILESLS